MDDNNDRTVKTTTDARAGSTPHVTRYVLGISLVLIIAAMAATFIWGSASSSDYKDRGVAAEQEKQAERQTGGTADTSAQPSADQRK